MAPGPMPARRNDVVLPAVNPKASIVEEGAERVSAPELGPAMRNPNTELVTTRTAGQSQDPGCGLREPRRLALEG